MQRANESQKKTKKKNKPLTFNLRGEFHLLVNLEHQDESPQPFHSDAIYNALNDLLHNQTEWIGEPKNGDGCVLSINLKKWEHC